MHFDFAVIEKHKAATIGAILIGGLVLFLYWRNSSDQAATVVTSGTAQPSDAVQEAEIAASTQLQEAQLSANASASAANATLANNAQQAAATYQLAQLQATTGTQQQVNALGEQATEANDQLQLSSLGLTLQQKMEQDQTNAAVSINQQNNAAAVTEATLANSTSQQATQAAAAVALASTQAGVAQTQIVANENLGIAGLNAQTAQTLAGYNAGVAITQSNNQASAAKSSSWASSLGQLAFGVMAAFA